MASSSLSDIESKINEVRNRLANLSSSFNTDGPLTLMPTTAAITDDSKSLFPERNINESVDSTKSIGGLGRLVELAKREAAHRHGERKQQHEQQQQQQHQVESHRTSHNTSFAAPTETDESKGHIYCDPEGTAPSLPPRSFNPFKAVPRRTVTESTFNPFKAVPRRTVTESTFNPFKAVPRRNVTESTFDPFKAVQARLREKFIRGTMPVSPPSSPERDDASESPSPYQEPQPFQKYTQQRESCDAKDSQQRESYDASLSQQRESYDASHSQQRESCDAKHSQQREFYDAKHLQQQESCNANRSQQRGSRDTKVSQQREFYDAKYLQQQELYDAKRSQQRESCDAKRSQQRESCDAKRSQQREQSRSRFPQQRPQPSADRTPARAQRMGGAATPVRNESPRPTAASADPRRGVARRPSAVRSGSPFSGAQAALPARTAPHRTVLDVLSGAEVFALMRLRGVLVSRGDTGEYALPDTRCHSVYLSPDEHKQLVDLRTSIQHAATSTRRAPETRGKPVEKQKRRAPVWT